MRPSRGRACVGFVAAMVVGGVVAGALGQVSIVSGFDSASNWSVLLVNNPGQNATVLPSGGNPGGYADLRPGLSANTVGGAGFYQTFPFFTLGGATPLTEVVMSADYRWFSGPTLTLIPFLYQQNLLYRPATSFSLGTDAAWTGLGSMTFPISSFGTSTGTPLNMFMLTQVGFMAVIRSETPTTVSARVGIDNLNLQIVPGPGAGVAIGAFVGAGMGRRRRPDLTR